jgi:hypothetical protein
MILALSPKTLSMLLLSKLHNGRHHDLYSLTNAIMVFKPRNTGKAEHVARTGRKGMHTGFWWGKMDLKESVERCVTALKWFRIWTSGKLL